MTISLRNAVSSRVNNAQGLAMRSSVIVVLLLVSAVASVLQPTFADDKTPPASLYVSPMPGATASQPNEGDLKEHGHYVNREGNEVHSPAHSVSGAVPQGATAQCRDGTYSFSQHRSGTCSHHGGVSKWIGG